MNKKKEIQNELNAKLISATILGFSGNVRRLLKKGANCNIIDKKGETVLYIAASNGDTKIVHLLLKKGAKNNVSKCVTPLDIAIILEHLEIIQLLIKEDEGIDLNQNNQNEQAIDPLSLAIYHKKLGSAKLLLESGAKVLIKHIPLDTKCKINFEIIKLLIPYLLLGNPNMPKHEFTQEYQELLTIWDDSLSQIKKMQNEFVCEIYSYYDLFSIDSNNLAKVVTMNNLVELKNNIPYENFSRYSVLLNKKLNELILLKEKQMKSTVHKKNKSFFKPNKSTLPVYPKYPRAVL